MQVTDEGKEVLFSINLLALAGSLQIRSTLYQMLSLLYLLIGSKNRNVGCVPIMQ